MPRANQKGVCFVIAPIGEEGNETRTRSDQVLRHVIAPAANECGYRALRADRISEPGIITSQVIQHLVEDPLVIADLTDWNPNVFYELAVRHAVRKPVVQIIQAGQKIPFDVAGTRTIPLDHRDLDSVARCREDIVRQIQTVEKDISQVDTPISVAMDLQSLRGSENPLEKGIADIISMLQELRTTVGDLAKGASPEPAIDPAVASELLHSLMSVDGFLTLVEPGWEPTSEVFEEAQLILRRALTLAEGLAATAGVAPVSDQRAAYARWLRQLETRPGKGPSPPLAPSPSPPSPRPRARPRS